MLQLIETKLQKTILFLGGLLIFLRLLDAGYYERWEAILQSIGVAILTFILLVVLRGYDSMRIWRFIKRHKVILSAILIIVLLIIGLRAYAVYKESKEPIAYQNCLGKVRSLSTWEVKTETPDELKARLGIEINPSYDSALRRFLLEKRIEHNKYFDEWENAGKPYLEGDRAREVAFMEWMMKNHPDFCSEYDSDLIRKHIKDK